MGKDLLSAKDFVISALDSEEKYATWLMGAKHKGAITEEVFSSEIQRLVSFHTFVLQEVDSVQKHLKVLSEV